MKEVMHRRRHSSRYSNGTKKQRRRWKKCARKVLPHAKSEAGFRSAVHACIRKEISKESGFSR